MGFVELLMVCAILPICCLAGQGAPERHSLYYVYTALSKAVNAPGIFEFTAMGLLDDRKIDYYNSKDQVKIPQQDWMKEKLPADYWEKGTQSRKSKEQWFKVNVNILMERMRQNQSDVHVLMWKHGCEVDTMADGSVRFVRGVDAYSYDGKDFLSFDDNSMQWVAPVTEAVPTKQKWDGVPILNQYTKGYLEKECVDWLEKFRTYGDKELKQQVKVSPPKVRLFGKADRSSNTLKLTCMATGFYPKNIEITILKVKEVIKKGDIGDVLPNGDGTHQIKLNVEAQRSDMDDYRCEVYHIGLEEPITKVWTLDGEMCDGTSAFLIGAVLGGLAVLILIALILVFIAFKKGVIEYNGGLKYNGFETKKEIRNPDLDPPPAVVIPSVAGNVNTPLLGNGQANASTGQDANGTGSTVGMGTTLLQDGSGKLEENADSGNSSEGSSRSSAENVSADVKEGGNDDSGKGSPEGSTNSAEK
ncbi:class I histocompatibility antigen, F10 alpha chain-like [Alosa pseudoharengus]|uniref:class I histocompatibility antigen, F10 alpha chain-like n=1 Tax=Alosa pseudoharengus TaxID=34774 RepID=UPI003F8C0CC2